MSARRSSPDVVLSGRFEGDDERRYAHLPFDVPAGARQISLRCAYGDRIAADASLAGGTRSTSGCSTLERLGHARLVRVPPSLAGGD